MREPGPLPRVRRCAVRERSVLHVRRLPRLLPQMLPCHGLRVAGKQQRRQRPVRLGRRPFDLPPRPLLVAGSPFRRDVQPLRFRLRPAQRHGHELGARNAVPHVAVLPLLPHHLLYQRPSPPHDRDPAQGQRGLGRLQGRGRLLEGRGTFHPRLHVLHPYGQLRRRGFRGRDRP